MIVTEHEMTAIHLERAPAGAGKTGRFIERCREIKGTVLWLTPSLRRAEQLRSRLAGVPRLLLLTFPDLAGALIAANEPDIRPLSRCQARLIVEEVIAELHAAKHLPYFECVAETRGFAESVAGLIAELQTQGITPEAFEKAIEKTPKLQQLAALHAHYRQQISALGVCDPEGRLSLACRILHAHPHARPLEGLQAVFVDDFRSFTPPEREMLRHLGERCEEMWIALPGEEGEQRAELFAVAQREYSAVECVQASASSDERPAGLAHLERHLFRPVRQAEQASRATGILRIEAPGLVGEARMTARHIKTLLRDGMAAEDILVSVRDLTPYADLLREVFDEYGIPLDVEGTDSLLHDPAVALLLRALRLPEDDWPFSGVTALLRSSFLQPHWPEVSSADVPLLAEALLRLLREPRGRDAYLEAVRRWAAQKQKGLEDEQAEESRRQRIHDLAKQCAPFLERFFGCFDLMPSQAPLAGHAAWLHALVRDLGINSGTAGWKRFWEELDRWVDRDQKRQPIDSRTFQRRLQALASEAGVARTRRGPGRVRVLSAPLACDLDADYVFVLGLGERGFPQLVSPSALLEESERQALRTSGLELVSMSDLMPDEMLLFYRLVTRARKQLILGYPAVDGRGQPLLPSSFLSGVLDLFAPDAIPVERQSMLIEGFNRDTPLSAAEDRVRFAVRMASKKRKPPAGKSPMFENLCDAAALAAQRFREKTFSPFEGLIENSRIASEIAGLFRPEKVFSPTALEDYVACPFRFFLRHVLRLEPLEEPREEIEVTRRGQAFHRALSRLHTRLRDSNVHQPAEGLDEHVSHEVSEAIGEDVTRAPGPASKMLWQLEGQRMLKVASRYPEQWKALVAPWIPHKVQPRPHFFEIDFGLPVDEESGAKPNDPLLIAENGFEVRISGRIDRVDVAELQGEIGFWIIDYKTGSGTHYTGRALAEFERLQLTLYALAVQEVLLKNQNARPLGLAYWLIGEAGPKVVMPMRNHTQWLNETDRWRVVRETLREWILKVVGHIRQGVYSLRPRSEHCTQTCDFGQVCRISQARTVEKAWTMPLPTLPAST